MRGRYFLIIPVVLFLLYLAAKHSLDLLGLEIIILYGLCVIYYLSEVRDNNNHNKYYNLLCDKDLAKYKNTYQYIEKVYKESKIDINKVLKYKNMGFIIAVLPFYIFIIPYKTITFIFNYLDEHLSI